MRHDGVLGGQIKQSLHGFRQKPVEHQNAGSGLAVGAELVWGDYYLLESLLISPVELDVDRR